MHYLTYRKPVSLAKPPKVGRHIERSIEHDTPTRAPFTYDPDYVNFGFGKYELVGDQVALMIDQFRRLGVGGLTGLVH